MKTALLVVERDFLVQHVGVRRVVFHYWRRLERQGYRVSLAAPVDGQLRIGFGLGLKAAVMLAHRSRNDAPNWTSGQAEPRDASSIPALFLARSIVWTTQEAHLDRFDVSLITNPWLCAGGLPEGPISAGIVYDMVPNLLACGALNLGKPMDIYAFAAAHDRGYRLFLERAEQILCISESSRSDFVDFYRLSPADQAKVRTVIPFEVEEGLRIKARPVARGERPRILLVNVLDPRKNFDGVRGALRRMSGDMMFDIDVVGRERMPIVDVMAFLRALTASGHKVNWYRDASDACLHRLYADADILIFPSFYEGLGLPILEAQTQGVPVVSANTSSCVEVNMNPQLCVDPLDHAGIAERVRGVVENQLDHLSGHALKLRLEMFLAAGERWRPQ